MTCKSIWNMKQKLQFYRGLYGINVMPSLIRIGLGGRVYLVHLKEDCKGMMLVIILTSIVIWEIVCLLVQVPMGHIYPELQANETLRGLLCQSQLKHAAFS